MKPDNTIPPFRGVASKGWMQVGRGVIRPTPNTVWKGRIGIKSQTPEKTIEKKQKNMKQLLFTGEQKLFQLPENKKGPLANGVIHLSEGRSCAYHGLGTVLLLMGYAFR